MSLLKSVLILVVVTLFGCGAPVTQYRAGTSAPDVAPPSSNAPLHLIVAQAVGCVMFKPGTIPALRCFDLQGTSDADYKAQVVDATKQPNVIGGYYIPNHGAVLAAALQSRLAGRASVGIAGQDTQPGIVVRSELGITPTLVGVTLHAQSPAGPELTGNGSIVPEHVSLANLAWALPVLIVFFPSSEFWVPPIFVAMHHGQIEDAVVAAIDNAANNLAGQIPPQ